MGLALSCGRVDQISDPAPNSESDEFHSKSAGPPRLRVEPGRTGKTGIFKFLELEAELPSPWAGPSGLYRDRLRPCREPGEARVRVVPVTRSGRLRVVRPVGSRPTPSHAGRSNTTWSFTELTARPDSVSRYRPFGPGMDSEASFY